MTMEFEEKLKTAKPVPSRKGLMEHVATHGVSLALICKDLANLNGVKTMRHLEGYVRKATHRFRCSFAELLLGHSQFNSSVVKTADYFVSFAYDTDLKSLVDALERFRQQKGLDDIYVWISILSINQHSQVKDGKETAVQFPTSWFKNAFEESMSSIKKVLFVLSPISKPIALQRLWCIYELYLAVSMGLSLDVCLSEEDERMFVDVLLQDTDSIMTHIQSINSKTALADPAQEAKLRERIEELPGNYTALDHKVKRKLAEWLARAAKAHIEAKRAEFQQDKARFILLLHIAGTLFFILGEFQESQALRSEALYASIGHFGNEHPEAVQMLKYLAETMYAQRYYNEVESLYQTALKIDRKNNGDDDPTVAKDLSILADVLRKLKRYAEAEQCSRDAIKILRKINGDVHETVAVELNLLANMLTDLGRLKESEPLLREALAINRHVLGISHPKTGVVLNNLAIVLGKLGNFDGAETLLREAIEMNIKALGRKHPIMAQLFANLGDLLKMKGNLEEAETTMSEALEIARRTMGAMHPDLGIYLVNLGSLKREKGDVEAARQLFQEAFLLFRSTMGEHAKNTLIAKAELDSL